jgi:lysophospholipase L1-like esterase
LREWLDWRAGVIIGLVASVLMLFAAYRVDQSMVVEGGGSLLPADAPSSTPSLLLIGDSFAEGTGADAPTSGFPYLLVQQMGWTVTLDAQGGTGYLNKGPTEQFPDRTGYVDRSARHDGAEVDVVMVTGGGNDLTPLRLGDITLDDFRKAVETTFDNLRRGVPDARLIVVAPFWPTSSPPADVLDMRDVVREEATSRHLEFIDPLAGKWVTADNEEQVTGPDGTHPTQFGHQMLADRLAAALRDLGGQGSS